MKSEKTREYVELISEIGMQNNSLLWWTLWLPSRNRFNSPLFEKLKRNFKNKKVTKLSLSSLLGLFIKSCLSWIKTIFKWITVKYILIGKKKSLLKRFQKSSLSLITTFSYAGSFYDNRFNDPFWGELGDFLQKSGRDCLTLLKPMKCEILSAKQSKKIPLISPFLLFINFSDFIWVIFQMFKGQFYNLKGNYVFEGNDVSDEIKQVVRTEFAGANVIYSLLIYRAFLRIGNTFNVKDYYITYENNPWERMSILALRNSTSKDVLIKGYQHSVVPLASMNMFPTKLELSYAPFPDYIFTTGEGPREILIDQSDLSESVVINSCALRYKYLQELAQNKNGFNKRILVALEGVNQAAFLVNYILSQAKDLHEWEIVIRTHPVLSLDDMRGDLNLDPLSFPNIKRSTNISLIDDVNDADVVVYWGSTVALESIKMGVPIVHYDIEDIVNFDPLFNFYDFKWVVNNRSSLIDVLRSISSLSSEELHKKRESAKNYIDSYFYPVTDQNLESFLL